MFAVLSSHLIKETDKNTKNVRAVGFRTEFRTVGRANEYEAGKFSNTHKYVYLFLAVILVILRLTLYP